MKTTDIVLYTLLAVIVAGVAVSFYRYQKNPTFNILDLLMENGRVSRLAAAFMMTLVVTSWVMIKLTVDGKMTEGYLMAFGGMWIAPIISKMFATNNTTASTTSIKTVSVEATDQVADRGKRITIGGTEYQVADLPTRINTPKTT